MPKKRPALRKDENEIAFGIVRAMTGEGPRPEPPGKREKNPEAVSRGAKGGKKGGKARASKLTAAQRQAIARKAARTRWVEPPLREG
jgi:hypothetical protein